MATCRRIILFGVAFILILVGMLFFSIRLAAAQSHNTVEVCWISNSEIAFVTYDQDVMWVEAVWRLMQNEDDFYAVYAPELVLLQDMMYGASFYTCPGNEWYHEHDNSASQGLRILNDRSWFYILDEDGNLVQDLGIAAQAEWSPDGTKLVVLDYDWYSVWAIEDLGTTDAEPIASFPWVLGFQRDGGKG